MSETVPGQGLDAETQAWVDEKHRPPPGPLPTETLEHVAEIVERERARGEQRRAGVVPSAPQLAEDLNQPRVPVVEELHLFESRADPLLVAGGLLDEYAVPPFTLLDTRQGYWQERVRQWKGLGIQSELGRDDDGAELLWGQGCTFGEASIFDPLLTEIMYRWYSPVGGVVVDPFAGGSVRGIVATALRRTYVGLELRGKQVAANRQQADDILGLSREDVVWPRWIQGDSRLTLAGSEASGVPRADLIFTCPPYADLEVYSDDPADLSNMATDEFDEAYADILGLACDRLLPNRFAVIVVGRLRNKAGHLRDLVGQTIGAMEDAGTHFYDEAVLMNAVGTAAVRARRYMTASRKLVRMHQHALVFVKGDPRKAVARMDAA